MSEGQGVRVKLSYGGRTFRRTVADPGAFTWQAFLQWCVCMFVDVSVCVEGDGDGGWYVRTGEWEGGEWGGKEDRGVCLGRVGRCCCWRVSGAHKTPTHQPTHPTTSTRHQPHRGLKYARVCVLTDPHHPTTSTSTQPHRGLECFPGLADPASVTLTYEDEDGDRPTIARAEGAYGFVCVVCGCVC